MHQIESILSSIKTNYYEVFMSNNQSFWVLSHLKITSCVLFLLYLFYSQSVFASYYEINFQDSYISTSQNRQPAQDAVCQFSQDMLEIEIIKESFSTLEEGIFRFSVKMSGLQVDPSQLTYKWEVDAPDGSMISTEPISDYRLTLEPDQLGTYRITLTLQDPFQNCKYVSYIFQYPEVGNDLEYFPSIHALFLDFWVF